MSLTLMSSQLARRRPSVSVSIGIPGPLHARRGGHVPAPEQRLAERDLRVALTGEDARQHARQERREGIHVALAVVENGPLLGFRPGPSPQNQLPAGVLLGRSDAVQAVPGEGAQQAEAARRFPPVDGRPEFGEQVQDPERHRPAQRQEAAQLGGSVVGDEQGSGIDGERRLAAELVVPEAQEPAGAQLPRHQAHRHGALAVRRLELEVDRPDLAVGQRVENGHGDVGGETSATNRSSARMP